MQVRHSNGHSSQASRRPPNLEPSPPQSTDRNPPYGVEASLLARERGVQPANQSWLGRRRQLETSVEVRSKTQLSTEPGCREDSSSGRFVRTPSASSLVS